MFASSCARAWLAAALPLVVAASVADPAPKHSDRESRANFVLIGTVTAVEDGDTLTLATATGARFVIRLSDLDTPEIFHRGGPDRNCPGRVIPDRPGQPLGREARRSLEALARGAPARAECYEIDRYGRPVCHVFVASRNVNLEQIERGWGMLPERGDWIRDPASREAADRARARQVGVWRLPHPLHPAAWRESCWGRAACPDAELRDAL